jgi:cell division protein FtsL
MSLLNMSFAVLLLLVVASSLAVVQARHNSRSVFSELQAEKSGRDNWEVQYGQLQLEKGAWATHGRIERLARANLKMNIPSQQSVVLIRQ